MKTCECGQPIFTREALHCKKCGYKYKKRPSGLKYKIVAENPTWFKKGNIPWCTGTKGVMKSNSGSFKKGEHRSPETEFKYINGNGYRHFLYKGILASKCVNCGEKDSSILEIHHIDHNRKNNKLENMTVYCKTCHEDYHSKIFWVQKLFYMLSIIL